eukprot:CAMPEP_0178762198 /NCGR_PEP_ID=MMETSP0744-20121128/16408_1 /TAXON_ID=913974 /ORGANISM="Nitzschia punctata, Strain CCMP561" /LENGTH=283 /DNA_ID=CAMNT_0020416847 /DNA_START=119 /DNA_END=970 /DNA_ORIENTATION=-
MPTNTHLPSSASINNHACSLLFQGKYGEAFELFKAALSELKKEMAAADAKRSSAASAPQTVSSAGSPGTHEEDTSQPMDCTPTDGTCASDTADDGDTVEEVQDFCSLQDFMIPNEQASSASLMSMQWIYSRPLIVSREVCHKASSVAFAVTFNLALASHLRAMEMERNGNLPLAREAYAVALRLYRLPMQHTQDMEGDEQAISPFEDRNGFVYAAIFNNTAHAHASLQEEEAAAAYRQHLVKTLFFLADAGRVAAAEDYKLFDCFMDNVFDLVTNSPSVAAAA